MNSNASLVLTMLFVVVLSGCQSTSSGPPFSFLNAKNKENSIVYIYSDYGYTGISTPKIEINGKKIGSLSGGGYLVSELEPSLVTISVPKTLTWDIKTPPVTFRTEAGEQYFVKYIVYPVGSEIYPTGIIDVHFYSKLEIVNKDLSLNEIKDKRLSN